MTTIPDIDLQGALNSHLADYFPDVEIAWENTGYKPSSLTPFYFRAWLMPAEPRIATLGLVPYVERKGIYQVDCVYPIYKGFGDVKRKAAEVIATFPVGLRIVFNGLEVTIEKSWCGQGVEEKEGWYKVPVFIIYNCYFRG